MQSMGSLTAVDLTPNRLCLFISKVDPRHAPKALVGGGTGLPHRFAFVLFSSPLFRPAWLVGARFTKSRSRFGCLASSLTVGPPWEVDFCSSALCCPAPYFWFLFFRGWRSYFHPECLAPLSSSGLRNPWQQEKGSRWSHTTNTYYPLSPLSGSGSVGHTKGGVSTGRSAN